MTYERRISVSTAPWAELALPHVLELLAEADAPAVQIFGEEGRGHLFLSRWIGHQAAIDAVVVAARRSGLPVQSLDIGRSCCDVPVGKGGDEGALARLRVALDIAVRLDVGLICLHADRVGSSGDPKTLEKMSAEANAAGVALAVADVSADCLQYLSVGAEFWRTRDGDRTHLRLCCPADGLTAQVAGWLAKPRVSISVMPGAECSSASWARAASDSAHFVAKWVIAT